MSARRQLAWVLRTCIAGALLGMGCNGDLPSLQVDDIFRVSTVCTGDGCSLRADGETPATVEICIDESIDTRREDLTAKLVLSSGRWEFPDIAAEPRTVTIGLYNQSCGQRSFIPDNEHLQIGLYAAVGGFASEQIIALEPAELDVVEARVEPATLTPGQSQEIQISARVVARTGTPTRGTAVALAVIESSPPGMVVSVPLPVLLVDDQDQVVFPVRVPAALEHMQLRVTATPTGQPMASVTNTVEVAVTPVETIEVAATPSFTAPGHNQDIRVDVDVRNNQGQPAIGAQARLTIVDTVPVNTPIAASQSSWRVDEDGHKQITLAVPANLVAFTVELHATSTSSANPEAGRSQILHFAPREPFEPERLFVISEPPVLTVGQTHILRASPRTQLGTPPVPGTVVDFDISAQSPEEAVVTLHPASAIIDGSGDAQATLTADSTLTSITIRATATAPFGADGGASPPIAEELTLQTVPR